MRLLRQNVESFEHFREPYIYNYNYISIVLYLYREGSFEHFV